MSDVRRKVILSLAPPTVGYRVRMCGEPGLDDDGVARCERPPGHDGLHAHFEGDEIVTWDLN